MVGLSTSPPIQLHSHCPSGGVERARCIFTQGAKDKIALRPVRLEVESIAKGKARKPCDFGVKVSLTTTH